MVFAQVWQLFITHEKESQGSSPFARPDCKSVESNRASVLRTLLPTSWPKSVDSKDRPLQAKFCRSAKRCWALGSCWRSASRARWLTCLSDAAEATLL